VLEHPEASHAFARYGLPRPKMGAGWIAGAEQNAGLERVCQVEQGHYGHPARKKTWLYYVGSASPPELIWTASTGLRLDEGFHTRQERQRARASGQKPRPRLNPTQNITTPLPFRDLLLAIARGSRGPTKIT
jgi:hypothetical protein